MIRLPIPQERIRERVELTRDERHYLVDVLRLQSGAELEVFDGKGGRYAARFVAGDCLQVGERRSEALPLRTIVLAQALAKGEKMDLVVQKATELGVSEIAPFSAARSIVRLDEGRAGERVKRWQKIADEASRQCGRADVPTVRPVVKMAAMIEAAKRDGAAVLVLYEGPCPVRLSQALVESSGPAMIVIGPEGGFSPEEIAEATRLGAQAVTLGKRILRTETAGLAALAVARFLEGELG